MPLPYPERRSSGSQSPAPDHHEVLEPGRSLPQESEAPESLFERLKLKEQYLAQVKSLYKSGLLENFLPTPDHPQVDLGLTDIIGKRHYLPHLKDLESGVNNHPELKEKVEQGFTKLLIVPFGLPLEHIINRYKQVLLRTYKESGIISTNGDQLYTGLRNLDTQYAKMRGRI
jgi:hypothetical protein